MGAMSDWQLELQERRQQALDNLPDTLDESLRVIGSLQEQVEDLRKQVEAQGSTRERYKDYVVGGIIGAIISAVISLLLTAFL
jgi:hypothetical protein